MEEFEQYVRDNSQGASEYFYGMMSALCENHTDMSDEQYWFDMGFHGALAWLSTTFGFNLVCTEDEIAEAQEQLRKVGIDGPCLKSYEQYKENKEG
jgi:hypothetical protein